MNKIRTNRDRLIIQAVIGAIVDPPANIMMPYRVSADGELMVMPGTGGITYNARIGDSAIDWWADHVEPAVSIRNPAGDAVTPANGGLQVMTCAGNRARVVSGDAKDEWGRVTGKHGGIFNVMVDFTREQMEKMAIGDKIQVMSTGQGLEMSDFPDVKVRSIDPDLFEVIDLRGNRKTGIVEIPVTHVIPAALMGSGLGKANTFAGDYDIQMFDEATVEKHQLNSLRFGDFVAITDADHTYGRIYRQKSVSVGIIVHSRSVVAGHGPGVMTVFTSTKGNIEAVIDPDANLKNYFTLIQ